MSGEQSAPTEPKAPWLDPACAILMAITTLATAWCSFQSSRWSGQAAELDAFADKRERDATSMHLASLQTESVYVRLVMEVVDAHISGKADLEQFYTKRFPADLRSAWDKWIALKPFEDSSAPLSPLLPAFFTPPFTEQINVAKDEAAKAQNQAHVTGGYASTYLSNTVVLATVLFFAGTASKFDQRRVRQGSLAFAIALFTFAAVRTLMLPIA